MQRFCFLEYCLLLLVCFGLGMPGFAQDEAFASLPPEHASADPLMERFQQQIQPLLATHCLDCHGSQEPEAALDLSQFQSLAEVVSEHRIWEIVLERVEAEEMPPEDTSTLSATQRQVLLDWIREVRDSEAQRNAGDPGPVLARRLSNAEYDYSIRDLTGVDIRPTKTFPVDPANESGFDNSGESLSMSPALISKYLSAAREVSDHLVFVPSGLRFAPHPVATPTDRDKYCVKRIVDFYYQQPTDYADYFLAAWRVERERRQVGEEPFDAKRARELVAEVQGVSPKYLHVVWKALHQQQNQLGPLHALQQQWREVAEISDVKLARQACQAMRDWVLQERKKFEPHIENLQVDGIHKGSQPFVLWKNDQYAAHRRKVSFDSAEARLPTKPSQQSDQTNKSDPSNAVTESQPQVQAERLASDSSSPGDADQPLEGIGQRIVSNAEREQYRLDCQEFCHTFPDAFYISERGRDYLDKPREQQEKGRLLSAGFHSMMGYYRDDQPLVDLILSDAQRRQLDQLWEELEFFADVPARQYQGFLWFDRTDSRFMRDPEFDFARPEDRKSLTAPMIEQLSEVYLAKAKRNGGTEVPLGAIQDYFLEMNRRIRWVEKTRLQSESGHVEAVLELAAKAYRRPLLDEEVDALRDYYHALRTSGQLSHTEAIQDTLVSVLISPHFCYRVDLLSDSPQPRALDDFELASRLSYFLWSSLPDDELLQLAARGQLREREILIQQTQRMLQDARLNALATEFGGNWLGIRRFEEHNSVDRERFPTFDDTLRTAMFEEPMRFFVDLVQRNGSILEFLHARHTFVNESLAKHYGMSDLDFSKSAWQPVAEADEYGRGGLLPMAVFLTKNAPGLRTSPVKRGYWVARNLLGEHIPPPPPNVPELPNDESDLGELSLSEVLAKHREHRSCSGCHDRIDPLGLVFEGFGPVGEQRTLDLGGKPVQRTSDFPDGSQRVGLAGLRAYLRQQRTQDFVENFHRKLLAFALGRSLQLSDQTLLDDLRNQAEKNEYRIGVLIESIVTSPQFLNKRGQEGRAILAQGKTHEK